eukprot:443258-Amphidinium_carterae.1
MVSRQELHQGMENQIEDVNRELAWTIEFHERGLQKIKATQHSKATQNSPDSPLHMDTEVDLCDRTMVVKLAKDHFLGKLDFERIEVLAFASPHRVSTFRCQAMSEDGMSTALESPTPTGLKSQSPNNRKGGKCSAPMPVGGRASSKTDRLFVWSFGPPLANYRDDDEEHKTQTCISSILLTPLAEQIESD